MKYKKIVLIEALFLFGLLIWLLVQKSQKPDTIAVTKNGIIKWVDFNISYEALVCAYEWDVKTYEELLHINWIELLAYTAAKSGGEFSKKAIKQMNETARLAVEDNKTIESMAKQLKYYDYYLEAYDAVLSEYVGEYEIEEIQEDGTIHTVEKYGIKAFLPIAKGFEYSDYDDFGASRSYGYKRVHLGHDMMGRIGTPIIAVESGTIEALGWNRYGGWRIGIRSFDQKRYYYYAHLRQNYPYQSNLEVGSTVTAGDVIGYMGHTGYSTTENVNNIETVHLHFGIQLIFDESQKEGNAEIWIDCYNLVRFLSKNQSQTEKVEGTKEWKRCYQMKELSDK